MKYLAAILVAVTAYAQTAPRPEGTAISGAIVAKSADGKQLTVKADNGTSYTVAVEEATPVYEVPLGAKSLRSAVKITIDRLNVGDRVIARGNISEPGKMAAIRIISMSKADIAKKQAEEEADWQKRGVSGIVTAVDPATHQFTIKEPMRAGAKTLTVTATDKTDFHKYAVGSIRFRDAKPSSLAELKVGDQVRVLGDKNADDTQVAAERVVFGTFRLIPATVVSVNPEAHQITINDLEKKQQLVVNINADSQIKRLPPMIANFLAMRVQGGGAAPAGAGFQRPAGAAGGSAWRGGAGGAGGSAGGGQGHYGGPGAAGHAMGGDLSAMVERLPSIPLTDLKPGDAVIVHSSAGADASSVTAITILAGAEPILTKRGERPIDFGSWGLDPMGGGAPGGEGGPGGGGQ
jgi:uncharacterized membrane protein YgcG